LIERARRVIESSSSGSVFLTEISPGFEPWEVETAVPSWSDSSSSYSLTFLQHMADQISLLLDQFMEATGRSSEGEHLFGRLRAYMSQALKEVTRKRLTGSFSLFPQLETEETITFGMSESTVRRLWDNEADRFWDDL